MILKRTVFFLGLIAALLLQGCAGTRHSYHSLLDKTTDFPTIYISVGETKEVLAIGDGWPGWWGWYPAIRTVSPDIASVDCEQKRGLIPFREPGVVFGGAVCFLTAHKPGETMARYGNKYNLEEVMTDTESITPVDWVKIVVTEP